MIFHLCFAKKYGFSVYYPLTMHHPPLNDVRLSALVSSLGVEVLKC